MISTATTSPLKRRRSAKMKIKPTSVSAPMSKLYKISSLAIIITTWCCSRDTCAFAPGRTLFRSFPDITTTTTSTTTSASSFATTFRRYDPIRRTIRNYLSCATLLRLTNHDHDDFNDGKNSTTTNRQRPSSPTQEDFDYHDLSQRVLQLERLASFQAMEIKRLKAECKELKDAAVVFAQVVDLLRRAGDPSSSPGSEKDATNNDSDDDDDDHASVFGAAPSSVVDAADDAGAAVLAAVLAGKQRMLLDARDAELTRDPDALVRFLELAVLPVAAGLEGIARVRIVLPTVSQLLTYRRFSTLAAPDVVALSTLGYCEDEDEEEENDAEEINRDSLVVVVAPSPDDKEGLSRLNRLLDARAYGEKARPVVVVNHHMVPLSEEVLLENFEIVYHLRLLSVQFSTDPERIAGTTRTSTTGAGATATEDDVEKEDKEPQPQQQQPEDVALEAAMEHAQGTTMNLGSTRAMVIRAYPRPWHVFVDTSPDADVDFEVAATFDVEPAQDEINYAIVECLEGSEREDELVAQQMQEALEAGQLDRISELVGSLEDDADDDENDDDECYGYDNEDSC